jgi:lysozyme family protein
MYSPQITPFQPSNIDATTKMLMGLQQKGQLQQYVAQHKNDPNLVSLALYVSNMSKARPAVQAEANQPKIVDQAIAGMAPPQEMMPEDQGIATLPAPNMQNMAGGGIVAFEEGGDVPGYAGGGTPADAVFDRAFKKVLKFEGGSKYLKDDAGKGPTKYGINQTANPDIDIKNLTEDQAKEIYRKRYWNAIGGDALAAKNPHLATIAFDAAVNQGPGTAKQMLAQAGDSPYELLKLRQQRYVDLKNQNPEKFGKYLGGWTERVASLQKDFEQDRSKQGLPALTPGAQAMAATGPESTQPDLDSSKAGIISSGLAALSSAAPAVYEAFTPSFKPGTTMSQALGRTAATAGPLAGVGATGAALSTGAANALSNATPEQLDQLSTDIGSDTGIAAAIMNAPNRPPEKPPMPYGEQMANIAKTIVSAPDRPRKPEPAPEPAPEVAAPQGGMPDLNQAFRQFELGQQNKAEDVQVAKPEITPEAIAAAPKDEKTGGTDWNKLMLQMGLQLMSGKSPNMLTNIGEAGLGTLAMQQAEEKAKSEREAKMSEAEYRKAMGKYYDAQTAATDRGAKEKSNVALAEKAAQDAVDTWAKNNKMALLQSPDLYEQVRRKYRMEAYQSFGITPTMTAGAPTGGAKFLGFENPA